MRRRWAKDPTLRGIPGRLRPYLKDLTLTGLWGLSVEKTAIQLIEVGIQAEVKRGSIRPRIWGKVVVGPQ